MPLLAILALSVGLRVSVALYYGDTIEAPPLLTDQRSYHELGARLVAGHGFSFPRPWYPFTPAESPTAHWSFLYSLAVAGVYAVTGVHPLAVRLVQAVLGGILVPWLVFRLARRAMAGLPEREGERAARLAALLAAAYGYFVLYAAVVMTETLFIAAVLWTLETGLRLADRLRSPEAGGVPWQEAGALGLGLAAAVLLRQSILPWVAVLAAALAWVGWRAGGRRVLRRALAALAVAVGVVALSVVPWTVRNARAYGRFLLLNSNAGYAMYSAQHPMHGTSFREFDAAPLPADLPRGNEAEMDAALMRAGIRFVLEEPARYLRLSLSRVRAYFEFWPTAGTTLLHNLGRSGSFGLLLPFMAYGLVVAARKPAVAARCGLLFLFMGVYTLLHVLTWAMVRYRLPVDAVLMPFAALALSDLHGRWVRARARRRAR